MTGVAARIILALAGAASVALAPGLSAQSQRPPPVTTVAPPANIDAAYRQAQLNYRAFCGDTVPSVTPPNLDGVRLSFDTGGSLALLSVCFDEQKFGFPSEIASSDAALTFLALRDMEPLWPLAEEKWGNDLGLLRAELREIADSTAGSTAYGRLMEGGTDRVRARSYALSAIGYFEEAVTSLEAETERLSTGRLARRSSLDFERVTSVTARASIISIHDSDEAAAAVLKQLLDTLPRDHDHRLNALINYAAYLAETGNYREARDLLEPAYQEFRTFQGDRDSYKIGGSDREFSWILACAYHGMGDESSAAPYRDVVNLAEESPADEYIAETKRSSTIKLRMYACMDDREAYFELVFGGSFSPMSNVWSALQGTGPAVSSAYNPAWGIPPDYKARYLERYRILPESYADALARWSPSVVVPGEAVEEGTGPEQAPAN